jgi:hypothetical protein
LQELIRRWGEANGWRATVEGRILDGLGNVDVALERDQHRIACEISVSSTTDYEVGNIRKCLAAGFSLVVSIVADRGALVRLKAAVARDIERTDADRVRIVRPDEAFAVLEALAPQEAESASESTVRGYRVTVRRGVAGNAAPNRGVAQTIVGALKRMREKKP